MSSNGGWCFFAPEAVPDEFRERAVPVMLVPLLPEEADQIWQRPEVGPALLKEDREFLRAVASGKARAQIAKELGIPLRSVDRRLSKLCKRFGVATTSELVSFLARRGF